jgi:hypothetical protein
VSTQFKKGHSSPGPGRPKCKLKENKETFFKIMNTAKVKRVPVKELEKAQDAAVALAQSGDFNFYKFIIEREDDYVDTELLEVQSLPDSIAAKNQVMKQLSRGEITLSKSKKIMDALKQSRDLDIDDAVLAAENIKKARGE